MIGSDQANPVVLTACEWMDVFVDQQEQVRRGILKNSYWELLVDHVTEKKPFSFEGERKNVRKKDRSAIFTVQIEACPVTLHTWFDDQNNQAICGAYYVYVRRKQE